MPLTQHLAVSSLDVRQRVVAVRISPWIISITLVIKFSPISKTLPNLRLTLAMAFSSGAAQSEYLIDGLALLAKAISNLRPVFAMR